MMGQSINEFLADDVLDSIEASELRALLIQAT
jgi:hypothetical protein